MELSVPHQDPTKNVVSLSHPPLMQGPGVTVWTLANSLVVLHSKRFSQLTSKRNMHILPPFFRDLPFLVSIHSKTVTLGTNRMRNGGVGGIVAWDWLNGDDQERTAPWPSPTLIRSLGLLLD